MGITILKDKLELETKRFEHDLENALCERLTTLEIKYERQRRYQSKVHRSGQFRPDVTLYRNGRVAMFLECKIGRSYLTPGTRQWKAYLSTGLPWQVVSWENLDVAIERIVKVLNPAQQELAMTG